MDEAQYLFEQRERAKAGMRVALRDLKDEAARASDVREWAKVRPWATMAAGVAAGFVAAGVLQRPARAAEKQEDPHQQSPGAAHRFIALLEHIVLVAKPLISAILMAQEVAESHSQSHSNGHPRSTEVGDGI
jgi:hypothetical protein